MINKLRILLAFLLVLTSLTLNIFSDMPKAEAAPIGSCDSYGRVEPTTSGGFTTVKYSLTSEANNAGNSSSCTYTVPTGVTQLEFLVVGGGGGGGGNKGGGGSGGGLIHYKNFTTSPGTSISIAVGSGGSGSSSNGSNGETSTVAGKSAAGGGGGGVGNGSSGFGGTGGSGPSIATGIFPNNFYTNSGSNGLSTRGGSGGGATAIGSSSGGGNGYTFAGTTYAGGGGGGAGASIAVLIGGSGGGGSGGIDSSLTGNSGTNGLGGGGGGGGNSGIGARGGGGVVIVRYQSCTFSSPTNYLTGDGSNYKNLVRVTSSDSNSSCTSNWSVPSGVSEVEVFVLAGGGGGGGKLGGGGGSGGAILQTSYAINADTSIAVTVGGGGRGGYGGINDSGGYGANSIFGSLTAYGGGYGGDEAAGGSVVRSGRDGGSGGGSNGGGSSRTNGVATQAFGTGTKYGSNGGLGVGGTENAPGYGAGGGGGLGGAGGSGSSTNGGTGGVGIAKYGINLGGGGGGGVNTGTAGSASYGAGTGSSSGNGGDATVSTGGGGGGARNNVAAYGGRGGSGTIFILYHQDITITFNSNGGSDTNTTQTFQSGVAETLSGGRPTRNGYTFTNWNSQADGNGTYYSNNASYIFSTNTTLYAKWSPLLYSITYNYLGATDGNRKTNDDYTSGGQSVNLPSPSKTDYVFGGWYSDSEFKNFEGLALGAYTPTSVQTNINLYAKWNQYTYSVTYFDANSASARGADGGTAPLSQSGATVTSITLNANTLSIDGYVFSGWATSNGSTSVVYQDSATVSISANTTLNLYPVWTGDTYTVTYNYNGATGGNSTVSSAYVTGGSEITLPTPTRTGYTFSGWYSDSGLATSIGNAGASYSPTGATTSLTIYAKWSASTIEVAFNPKGGSPGGKANVSVGSELSAPTAPTRSGYTFSGWALTTDGTPITFSPTYTVSQTSNFTLYAIWSANTLTVTLNYQDGRTDSTTSVLVGSNLNRPTSPTRSGYTFSGWSTTSSGSTIVFPYAHEQSDNFMIYAIWTVDPSYFTVTFNSGGGSGSMADQVANSATNLTLNTFTRTGHNFTGWYTEPNGKGTPYADGASFAFTSNTTLFATWIFSGYVVSFDTQGGNSLNEVVLNNGSSISTPTEPTKSGSTFSGWSVTSSGSTLTFPYTPATFSDLTLYAIWSTPTFTVTFDSNGGTAVGNQSTTVGGTLTEPSAPTKSGYIFMGWTKKDDDPAVNFPFTHGASSNFTLYAIWINSYTITFDPRGGNSVSPITVLIGASTAAPTPPIRDTYTFNGWWTEVSGGTQVVFPYTPSENITLRAQWLPNFFSVVFDSQGGSVLNSIQLSTNSLIDTPTASIRSGYRLLGWSLDKAGSLINFPYNPNNAPTQLFAIWQLITNVTVTFESNGGVGSMVSQVANTSSTLSVNTYTRSGFSFTGWNTSVNGSGTAYLDSATYDFSADLTLYAIWIANAVAPSISVQPQSATQISGQSATFSVSATASDGGELSYQWYLGGLTISGATSSTLIINNVSSGNAGDYTVVITNSKNSSLATQTSSVATLTVTERTYSVIYTAPDKEGGSVPVDSGGPYTFNTTITLPGNTGSLTRGSYVFAGWRTSSDPSLRVSGSDFTVTSDVTFIAVWTEIYQLSFNRNGGAGTMNDIDGPSVTIPANTFTKSGYTFSSWNTQSDGQGSNVSIGITVPLTQDVTLYAIWSSDNSNVITFNTISSQNYGATIDLSSYVSASSGLTITAISNNSQVCTLSGLTLTAIAVGTCSITASQLGDGSNSPAASVTSTFTVTKKSLTITVENQSINFGSTVSNPTYTQSGLVTALGDLIASPAYFYTGTSSTYYARSTSKPTAVGTYLISISSISLSSGATSNYQISFVSGNLSIASVASNSLTGITLKRTSGDNSTNLISNFDNSVTSYSVYVEAGVSAVLATILRSSSLISSARVKVNNSGWRKMIFKNNTASTGSLPLPSTMNTVVISTIASDKGTKEFTITVYRDTKTAPTGRSAATPAPTTTPTPAINAISSVGFLVNNGSGISSGLQTLNLSPSFSRTTYSYSANLANTQSVAIMKADFTAAGVTLKLKVNNGAFTTIPNTGYSSTISLNIGSNTAILRVSSSDGTSVDYTFTLTRVSAQSGLTPTFATPTATSDGFTVQISNYSNLYNWTVSTSAGSASINSTGLITVTGSPSGTSLNVVSLRSGYTNGRSTLTYP